MAHVHGGKCQYAEHDVVVGKKRCCFPTIERTLLGAIKKIALIFDLIIYVIARRWEVRMEREVFEKFLRRGESTTVEFKRCGSLPGKDSFETICSFANRNGGNLFLGVGDDGSVEGVSYQSLLD